MEVQTDHLIGSQGNPGSEGTEKLMAESRRQLDIAAVISAFEHVKEENLLLCAEL